MISASSQEEEALTGDHERRLVVRPEEVVQFV
jgi:hypothetical protein